MLENLDSIDWSSLEAGHGTAENTPALLKTFAFSNEDDSRRAFAHLCEWLNHQGSVYTASFASIPFLIELLPIVDIERQCAFLELLGSFMDDEEFDEPNFEQTIVPNDEEGWHEFGKNEFIKGWSLYLNLFSSPDLRVRRQIVFLLTYRGKKFPLAKARIIGDQLLNILTNDPEQAPKIAVLTVLEDFWHTHPDEFNERKFAYVDQLNKLAEGTDSLSLQASLILFRMFGDETSPVIIERVIEIAKGSFASKPINDFRQAYSWADFSAIRALECLPLPRYIEAMRSVFLVENARELDFNRWRLPVVRFLNHVLKQENAIQQSLGRQHKTRFGSIYYVFPKTTEQRSVNELSPEQKEALRIALAIDELWQIRHNLLEMYGFAESRDELRQKLGA
jgi:hypothetical protein